MSKIKSKTVQYKEVELDTKEVPVHELIDRIRTLTTVLHRERLANDLLTLFNDAKEEGPDCSGIEVGSLDSFYNFIILHTQLKCPTISLTPDNNIYASWREEHGRMLSVHFLANGNVRFVIFKPNDKHPERKIRLSGTATIDTLLETSASSGIWDWISE